MAKKERVFVRGLTSATYGLGHFRKSQLAAARVRDDSVVVDDAKVGRSGDSEKSRTWWRIGPGDEEFLTQTLRVHFVELSPQSSNRGHGHQNEAAFYILEGAGYEIHDDQRYHWKAGDLVFVQTDSVHRHFNPWSSIWTDGVLQRKKVVTPEDTHWATTQLGNVRVLNSMDRTDLRQFSVDVFELAIPAGSRSGKHWKMADEVLYVLEGDGYSLHWEVQEEIAEKYYARIATNPTRHEIKKGDTLYVPQNTVVQHFAADGSLLQLLSAQDRVFNHLGYDKVHYFEDAPEYAEQLKAGTSATAAV
jgi:quercetin dioxygenase-like cupin family protein